MSEMAEKVKDYFTSSKFKREEIMDKLSEFLTVEKGGVKLYEAALKHVKDMRSKRSFTSFTNRPCGTRKS